MDTLTKEIQDNMTPQIALEMLQEGNQRFLQKNRYKRDLHVQIHETKHGQFPFAAILGCIDSRVPSEYIFDTGFGDIFNVRVAGNIINEDVLGSLEYSCNVAGAKLILVLGHTACGAVTAACEHVELGHITHLLYKIKPAVDAFAPQIASGDYSVDAVAERNVFDSMEKIRKESLILAGMESKGEILIKGAMYDVATGEVRFL